MFTYFSFSIDILLIKLYVQNHGKLLVDIELAYAQPLQIWL